MRTIGNIERFLVIGIVVVIGAILAVAMKGAGDLDSAYKQQVAAAKEKDRGAVDNKRAPDGKRPVGGSLKSDMPRNGGPEAGSGGGSVRDPGTNQLSPEIRKILEDREKVRQGKLDALGNGESGPKPDPSKPDPQKPDGPKPEPPKADGPKSDPNKGDLHGNDPAKDPAKDAAKGGGAGEKALGPAGDKTDEVPPVVLNGGKSPNGGMGPAGTKLDGNDPATKPDPATKKNEPAAVVDEWNYVVQAGDRLEKIAVALYGERALWKEIVALNPAVADPAHIKVGMQLKLPKAPVNTTVTGLTHGSKPVVQESAPVNPANVPDGAKSSHDSKAVHDAKSQADSKLASGFKRVTSSESYEVQRGDTLMGIAATHYGSKSAWRMILSANAAAITDKDHIKPGTVLKLPAQ